MAESMPSPAVKNSPSSGQLSPELSQTPPPNLSIEERLQRLKRLRDQGLITDEEYGAKRRELLDRL